MTADAFTLGVTVALAVALVLLGAAIIATEKAARRKVSPPPGPSSLKDVTVGGESGGGGPVSAVPAAEHPTYEELNRQATAHARRVVDETLGLQL